MMKVNDFINQLKKALGSHTVYATGAFGASIGNYPSQAQRYYTNMYDAVYKEDKAAGKSDDYAKKDAEVWGQKVLTAAKTKPCFAFDCVGLVKGILWGWDAKAKDVYGGADYESNGVPDAGARSDGLISYCKDVTTNFSKIVPGEMLWLDGHVGVYIGNDIAIECTTGWTDNVLKSVVTNIRAAKSGEYGRKWAKHGKLPWVDYNVSPSTSYSVVIEDCATKADAEKIQAALKTLGTNSVIKEK